ncbi:MAG: PDDEXK nuclease domain-containing protein [Marinifilaceae bacterium]|jgi:predicted nuclease of restriction endonuclease-like (RecB) superfamily|nr:PDDEXK nuclease domain-containing protein [Marinifilaceae bacterium]
MKPEPKIKTNLEDFEFIKQLKSLIASSRHKAYTAINFAQVELNWFLGQKIVEQEQKGSHRAGYGKQIIQLASEELNEEYGRGFSVTNLKNFRKFYLLFNQDQKGQTVPDLSSLVKSQTLSDLLSWSHYERLIRVESREARNWYIKEASQNNWGFRTLDRNISTKYYERLLASQIKEPVEEEMKQKTKEAPLKSLEFIKNPTVLEFLDLPTNISYTEQNFEKALIDNLQKFLLELGKGYAFVERQQLVRTETSDFYIDLVFYNYILKCFVLVELKTNKITHQDIGQLDMYVRMYDDLKRNEGDNPTIGMLLCTETDKTIAKYSVLKENQQLFATKYLPYLPSEEELVAEIEREKINIKQQLEKDSNSR